MIIHSYLTDGLIPWAELFIKSFRLHNGSGDKIILTTRDLTQNQIDHLYSLGDNLEIRNEPLDFSLMSSLSGVSMKRLKKLKNQVEKACVTRDSIIWKQFISVEDRYRNSIVDAMEGQEGFLLHFDIDMYVRKPLTELYDFVKAHDVCIRFRLDNKNDSRKVLGNLIGFRLSEKSDIFMTKWREHIDSLPITKKPVGFGQTSFYYAYRDLKDSFKWGHLPQKFSSAKRSKDKPIWIGNGNSKEKSLEICKEDFKIYNG